MALHQTVAFRDPLNPSADELRAWAYHESADEPMQDWDLIVLADSPWHPLMLTFAAAKDCPKQAWFLSALYLAAGRLYRSPALSVEQRDVALRELAQQARATHRSTLQLLAERLEALPC